MADQEWRLEGWDTFAGESYPIPGEYASEALAVAAAHRKLEELEQTQPSESSGGQAAIQDQVYVVGPAGQRYRVESPPSDGSVAEPVMGSFHALLAEIRHDCGLEQIPYEKITMLAQLCGPAEVDHLIRELDALDDADLVDDAGDMGDEYWRLRTAYSQALAEVGEPAVDPLLRSLGSENPQTRAYAVTALGLIGNPRAFSPIVALLAEEREDTIQMHLIEALGNLRDERAVPILLPYLQGPWQRNRGWIIRMAANALGTIGTAEVVRPLSQVLANDPDWFARLGAAEGLRKIHHPLATEALRSALKDEDPRVRTEVSAGLK